MYVYYCRTYEKAVSGGEEREKGTPLAAACGFESGKKNECLVLEDLVQSCVRGKGGK